MPTYQYACTECDHAFEQFQSFSDDALTECPRCSGRLRKLFNAVGVVFKGSGFYRNDSRAHDGTGSADSSGSSDSTQESGGAGTSTKEGAAKEGAAKQGAAKNGTSKPAAGGGSSGSGPASSGKAAAGTGGS